MRPTIRFLLLLLAWTALGRTVAWAAPGAGAKSITIGVQNRQYTISAFSATLDFSNTLTSYRFETIPAAAAGTVRYPSSADGTGAYTPAAAGVTITPAQAAQLAFQPAGNFSGAASFSYTALETANITGIQQRSNAAAYNLLLTAADNQTNPILESSMGQKPIAPLTAGTTSPTNYRILTLPSTGTLFVNGVAATTNQLITSAQAAQLSYNPSTTFFGTASFTYAPADAAGNAGDAATYAIPVTSAGCAQNNTTLDFSRRATGEDWKNHASLAVNGSNVITSGFTSVVTGTNTNTFAIGNNGALPGPSLVWQENPIGVNPATTPNVSTVTFTFDRPVTNLSLAVQDIDRDVTNANFIDELTFDGYTAMTGGTPVALTAANFALGATNQLVGTNTVQGTGTSNANAAGNIVVTFTVPIQRLTLTFKNTAPYTNNTTNRTHTAGITSMTWCRLFPIANDVTTATLPSTAGQVGISPLSSTVDGTVTTYTVVTLPPASQGVLYYNSTGTTYAAVAAGQTLTLAQANSLRFAPTAAASGNSTFTYTVQDDNGQTSNTATYTIPVNNTPCATTGSLAFSGRPNAEDWKSHAPLAVPTGSTFTTVSTNTPNSYTTPSTATVSTLATTTFNGVQTLQWSTDYANTTDKTSTVTFTFNRPVSNFAVRVQDIDKQETTGNPGSAFIDQVVFTGLNGSTPVTPVLGPADPNTNTVAINGNTAVGTVTNGSAVDATVIAYFPAPITSLTLTYSNISTFATNPTNNILGIDLLSFCRLAPVANNITTASMLDIAGQTAISSLSATADGTIQSYKITSLPDASKGILYVNGTAATAGQTLTLAQISQLTFDPSTTDSNSAVTFTYTAIDDAGTTSNTATYTIPVTATGAAGTAANCANPGKDGPATSLATNPDAYYPSAATQTLLSGDKSIIVGPATGAATPIAIGDLLLVIQMQGADIDYTNTDAYGDGVAGGGASGYLSNGNFTAGTYEYVVAASAIPATGGTITLASGLRNGYQNAAATTTAGQRRFQVVRVPQYTNLTLTGTITPTAWNGSTGGIIAIDVAGQTNFNNFGIDVSGAGFRGGAGITATTNNGNDLSYVTTVASNNNAQKGEGIAGTPRYLNNGGTAPLDNTTDGYPGGSNSRGAPGNAGGGGNNNIDNSGGGGGANGGAGGRGGNNFASNLTIGGEPGTAFGAVSTSRLILGGGGGAGTTNNNTGTPGSGFASSGAMGGGIVMLRTGSVNGNGTISANGAAANGTSQDDGGGGGGAGGSILVTANTTSGLSKLALSAVGGIGGNNNPAAKNASGHGPGGGGGGGVIFTNGAVASANVAAGTNGLSTTNATPSVIPFGATAGQVGGTNAQISNSIANSTAGANCVADVATTITGPASVSAGQPTGTVTATFSNIGAAAASTVTQTVTLPTGAGLTAAQQASIVAAYPGTTFATTGTGTNTATVINFGTLATLASGASNSYSFAYTAPTTPTTTTPVTTTSNTSTSTPELGLTANNTASFSTTVGTAADVTVSLAGPTTLNAGQPTGTYTATFTNEGPNTATQVTRTVVLPAGATITAAQLAAIPGATASTTGTTTTINFGTLASLASDASSKVAFAFTAPAATGTSTLTGNTGPGTGGTSEGANTAPNQSALTLNTVSTADVKAAITASATATTGTFSVTFSNNGPEPAAGVVRTVQLPKGLVGTVTVSGPDAGSYDPTTGLVTYTSSPTSLAVGASLTSTISYSLTSNTAPVAATATVSTTTNEAGLMANNTATAVMPAVFDLATTLTGPTSTIAGSPTMLYVTTTNNGPNDAPVATQTVSIPSAVALTNVYITNGGTYTYNTTTNIGTVTFPNISNLPSGETITNSISFDAPASNFAPSAVVAVATGETTTTNNTAYLNANTASTNVAVTAATTAMSNEATTITANATVVSAGTVVTYTVTATNKGYLGSTSVSNVVEQVQLLPGLTSSLTDPNSTLTVGGVRGTLFNGLITFTTAAGTTTYNPTTGVLTYPTLTSQASGNTHTYDNIAVTVPANTGNDGQLLATASVRTAVSDPVPADNTSSVVVKVKTTADLASTITGPSTTTAGQTASYTATFSNKGTGTAISVAETVQLPAGLSNVVVQDPSGNVINNAYNATTGLVTLPTVASDPANTSQTFGISFTAPGQSFVVASNISGGTTDNVSTNDATVLRTTVSPTADVAVYVSGPATAVAGNAVTYAVTAVNNGPDVASTVAPTLQLPAGLMGSGPVVTNADGSSNNGVVLTGGGTYNATTGLVTFTAATLAAGDSRVGLVTFTMPSNPSNGLITGNASVTTTSTDLVASDNAYSITTSVAPATSDMADLITSITPPASPALAGSSIDYILNFRNSSATTAATKVMPVAYLPAGLTGVIVKNASGVVIPNAYNSTTGQVTFPTIDSQAPGNLTSYTVSLIAPGNSLIISASSVSSNTSDPNPANNIVGNQVNITPAYDVTTSLTGPTSAQPGSTNTYTVTTVNNGPSTSSATAGSTTQTVTVPAGSTVGLPTGASYVSSTGVITFPAISSQPAGPNGAVSNTFTVVMPSTGSLALKATVAAAGENNPANDEANLTTTPPNQAPVAQNVWNTLQNARGNTSNLSAPTGLPISPLSVTDADGTISNTGYTIVSIPPTSQGVLYFNGTPVLSGQMNITPDGLSFAPTPGFVGNATFLYAAVDNASAISNTALYTIPVGSDLAAKYDVYNTTKGGANKYVTNDILAQVTDPNAATYNGTGVVYNATTGVLQPGASNGLATTGTNAVLASGSTLPSGVSLDPATGRIYVSDASLLVNSPAVKTYTVSVTTTDLYGGTSTVPVTFTIGANPLPVTLVAFTAQAVHNRDAQLTWSTASEANNDHFEVERSFDGTSFTKLDQVAGQGTTSLRTAYTFTDAGVASKATGPVYYRLKQVDTDGTSTYSPVRTVSFAKATVLSLSLYPNPAQTTTTLELSQLPATTAVQVLVLDATGRTVLSTTLGGGLPQPLDVHTLATGTYNVVVSGTLPDGTPLRKVFRLTKD